MHGKGSFLLFFAAAVAIRGAAAFLRRRNPEETSQRARVRAALREGRAVGDAADAALAAELAPGMLPLCAWPPRRRDQVTHVIVIVVSASAIVSGAVAHWSSHRDPRVLLFLVPVLVVHARSLRNAIVLPSRIQQALAANEARYGPPTPSSAPARKVRTGRVVLAVAIAVAAMIALAVVVGFVRSRPAPNRGIALAYARAIVAFEHERGRPPLLGTEDWPVAAAGPVDRHGKPYLKRIPSAIGREHYVFWQIRGDSRPSDPSFRVIQPPAGTHIVTYEPYGFADDRVTRSYNLSVSPAPICGALGDPPTAPYCSR